MALMLLTALSSISTVGALWLLAELLDARARHRQGTFGGFANLGAARTLMDALATLRQQAAA